MFVHDRNLRSAPSSAAPRDEGTWNLLDPPWVSNDNVNVLGRPDEDEPRSAESSQIGPISFEAHAVVTNTQNTQTSETGAVTKCAFTLYGVTPGQPLGVEQCASENPLHLAQCECIKQEMSAADNTRGSGSEFPIPQASELLMANGTDAEDTASRVMRSAGFGAIACKVAASASDVRGLSAFVRKGEQILTDLKSRSGEHLRECVDRGDNPKRESSRLSKAMKTDIDGPLSAPPRGLDTLLRRADNQRTVLGAGVRPDLREAIMETEDLIWNACGGSSNRLGISQWFSEQRSAPKPSAPERPRARDPDASSDSWLFERLMEIDVSKIPEKIYEWRPQTPPEITLIKNKIFMGLGGARQFDDDNVWTSAAHGVATSELVIFVTAQRAYIPNDAFARGRRNELIAWLSVSVAALRKDLPPRDDSSPRTMTVAELLSRGGFSGERVIETAARLVGENESLKHLMDIKSKGDANSEGDASSEHKATQTQRESAFLTLWPYEVKTKLKDLAKTKMTDAENRCSYDLTPNPNPNPNDAAVVVPTYELQGCAVMFLERLAPPDQKGAYAWLYMTPDRSKHFLECDMVSVFPGFPSFFPPDTKMKDEAAACKEKNLAVDICMEALWRESVRSILQARRAAEMTLLRQQTRGVDWLEDNELSRRFANLVENVFSRNNNFPNVSAFRAKDRILQINYAIREQLHWFMQKNGSAPRIDPMYMSRR